MIPHKTNIPHIPAFVYLVLFLQPKNAAVDLFSWYYFPPSCLLWIILFSTFILIWTLTECLQVHLKYFCKISIATITIWHFYSNFSTPAIFFEEIEPMFVTYNISIATDDGWHHTIWWWRNIQGIYHLEKLS